VDDLRFDELTKVLARPVSRRQALKAVAALAVGGLLGETRVADVGAQGLPCSRLPHASCCSYCKSLYPKNPAAAIECYFLYAGSHGTRGPCTCRDAGKVACPAGPTNPMQFTCCTAPSTCQAGVCRCTPNCAGKTCGDDGCGGSCGTCGTGQSCQTGTCKTCNPAGSACDQAHPEVCCTGLCAHSTCCKPFGAPCDPSNLDACCNRGCVLLGPKLVCA
jgi:hypothetical protein